jgi:predicted dehydrogenase
VKIQQTALEIDYKPTFPNGSTMGIGIVGCGDIVKVAHLKAYAKYGLNVVGVYDTSPEAAHRVQEEFGIQRVFNTLDELLAHPDVKVVDIATHPDVRIPLMRRALESGKHILAQKPLALSVGEAREIVQEADRRGLQVAVNQNGRWAPQWRVATLLIKSGVIGDVLAITHLYDMRFDWIPGSRFDNLKHFAIYDYSIHWIDITRCWMEDKVPIAVRARDYRTPNQPSNSKAPWGMWVDFVYENGANAVLRGIGCSTTRQRGHPFWIHGTEGTIRGSVLGSDFVELEKDGVSYRYQLEGDWFPDGFAGTMGELMSAIVENREPYNSARHNLLSLQMTLAACKSADLDGQPVCLEEAEF